MRRRAQRFDPEFVPGGSSAGSGVAVGAGLLAFALGDDAVGSGRVPAAFDNVVAPMIAGHEDALHAATRDRGRLPSRHRSHVRRDKRDPCG